tara:strand:+ start:93 stop:491 length:399 start_codon:yes stop_codon:yes gene_type:complete
VACERLFHPAVKNKPVVVLGNNDGCIVSRSEEVKALGIPMGIPVSIGIAPTKSLAKLANRTAKKQKLGVLNFSGHPAQKQLLDNIPVNDVWGIGKSYTEKLNRHGIYTAHDLSLADDKWIQKHLTIASRAYP